LFVLSVHLEDWGQWLVSRVSSRNTQDVERLA